MGIKEFRERLGEVATGPSPIAVTHHNRVVGHYVPLDRSVLAETDFDDWLSARQQFRRRWIANDPNWKDRLLRMGWDEEGEPYENDPRS